MRFDRITAFLHPKYKNRVSSLSIFNRLVRQIMYYSNFRHGSRAGLVALILVLTIISLVSAVPIPAAESGLTKVTTTLSPSSLNRRPDATKDLVRNRINCLYLLSLAYLHISGHFDWHERSTCTSRYWLQNTVPFPGTFESLSMKVAWYHLILIIYSTI